MTREHGAHLFVAQESRREARAADHEYAISDGSTRFQTGQIVNAAAEGTRIREDRGGVVPVPSPSAAAPLERDVLAAVLQLLAAHHSVAWAVRMNTGGVQRENNDGSSRYIAFAFKGCSDIIGQMRDGRFLAIECKRPGGKATAEQIAFLTSVQRNRGVALLAFGVDDVVRGLRDA